MAVTVLSGALEGIDAIPIEVEVDLLRRLPSVSIVGLAASAVKESAERIRSALQSAGESFPRKRVVVNLAPADVKKEGTVLDLPMALGILAADGALPPERLRDVVAVGELSLAGMLRPLRGALSLAMLARTLGKTLVLPKTSAEAAAFVPGASVVGVDTLTEVLAWLRGECELPTVAPPAMGPASRGPDLADVRGQALARFALEVAAAGAHHLLMIGPPGCGKSMLAQRLPSILPEPSFDEALAITRVHSAAGLLSQAGLVRERPFRAPHHTVTAAALIGDRQLRPGEVSLAHHGVLFLDEAPEFARNALEVLRQPLEDGCVQLARARGAVVYPAAVTLVMASNPCPCGLRGVDACRCTDHDVHRYLRRLSGPLLDRVDLHVELQPLDGALLFSSEAGETSAVVRARVNAARARQQARGQGAPNGQLPPSQLQAVAQLTPAARDRLVEAGHRYALSARAANRIVKVARTMADLSGSARVAEPHVSRALAFRPTFEI